jgi:hypothetical protein
MKTRETDDAFIIEPTPGERPAPKIPPPTDGVARAVAELVGAKSTPPGNQAYKLPPRTPPTNLQRFEAKGRGPCVCGEAAILDRITGLCPPCWRAFIFGGR